MLALRMLSLLAAFVVVFAARAAHGLSLRDHLQSRHSEHLHVAALQRAVALVYDATPEQKQKAAVAACLKAVQSTLKATVNDQVTKLIVNSWMSSCPNPESINQNLQDKLGNLGKECESISIQQATNTENVPWNDIFGVVLKPSSAKEVIIKKLCEKVADGEEASDESGVQQESHSFVESLCESLLEALGEKCPDGDTPDPTKLAAFWNGDDDDGTTFPPNQQIVGTSIVAILVKILPNLASNIQRTINTIISGLNPKAGVEAGGEASEGAEIAEGTAEVSEATEAAAGGFEVADLLWGLLLL